MFWLGKGGWCKDEDEYDMCCGFVVLSVGYEKLPAFIMHVMFVSLRNTQNIVCAVLCWHLFTRDVKFALVYSFTMYMHPVCSRSQASAGLVVFT